MSFDNAWLEQDIVHCAKVLDLIKNGEKIALISLDSLVCEFWFGKVRMHSQMDNSIDRAKQVIADQFLIDYLSTSLDIDIEPNKVRDHHTQQIQIHNKISIGEMRELDDLAETMMQLIQHKYPTDKNIDPAEIAKFEKVKKFWNEIQKCVPKELYWKKIDEIVVRQVNYRPCNEAQGISGRLFQKDIKEVDYSGLKPGGKKDKK
ncbi:Conserved_hypothetical protein [Hexamita inflata]|uniref:Uncharacterized protein n=1 Tax=Hexamita inflata TaxID=28002 RepID=A0AA86V3Q6_9EUKA|nr:Conserved hypothetical protein [Hexamita inflata]